MHNLKKIVEILLQWDLIIDLPYMKTDGCSRRGRHSREVHFSQIYRELYPIYTIGQTSQKEPVFFLLFFISQLPRHQDRTNFLNL